MPSITPQELSAISAALRDIRTTVNAVRKKAPAVAALCDNIERLLQPAENTLAAVNDRR